MNFRLSFLLPFFLVTTFACRSTHNQENPYGLRITTNVDEYLHSVSLNPDNQMVDLSLFVKGITLDVRYATTNNFTGEQIYEAPLAFVRQPVAEALKNVSEELALYGLGIKVFDAYRPYSATLKFYEVMKGDTNFVAAPWKGSRHNRGCAVDVTLIDINTGVELPMPTAFDDFTEKAAVDYPDLPDELLKNRKLLIDIMTKYGFETYAWEWWHYDFSGWENFDLMDISFESLHKTTL